MQLMVRMRVRIGSSSQRKAGVTVSMPQLRLRVKNRLHLLPLRVQHRLSLRPTMSKDEACEAWLMDARNLMNKGLGSGLG